MGTARGVVLILAKSEKLLIGNLWLVCGIAQNLDLFQCHSTSSLIYFHNLVPQLFETKLNLSKGWTELAI